ncbi:MAG: spore coat associated protein CotJA [Acutalibacteraceae bacterium]|nr:spore coat associated protein CotJA [Acutalibacteraceae bacterium]
MDRRMFDMSEFYRADSDMRSDPVRDERYRINSESDEKCTDPLTMVFINMQPLDSVYPLNEAYDEGTLFPNLNKPYLGGMSNER